jgi:hypothetical protein
MELSSRPSCRSCIHIVHPLGWQADGSSSSRRAAHARSCAPSYDREHSRVFLGRKPRARPLDARVGGRRAPPSRRIHRHARAGGARPAVRGPALTQADLAPNVKSVPACGIANAAAARGEAAAHGPLRPTPASAPSRPSINPLVGASQHLARPSEATVPSSVSSIRRLARTRARRRVAARACSRPWVRARVALRHAHFSSTAI